MEKLSHKNFEENNIKSVFKDMILECPKCLKPIFFKNEYGAFDSKKITCPHCRFTKTDDKKNQWILMKCRTCHFTKYYHPEDAEKILNENLICFFCSSKGDKGLEIFNPDKLEGKYVDPYFKLPYYLQTKCCNDMIYSLNYEVANILKDYVKGGVKDRIPSVDTSFFSKLPSWIRDEINRDEVLSSLETIEQKFLEIK